MFLDLVFHGGGAHNVAIENVSTSFPNCSPSYQ